ncbi:hypothetical protein CEK62_16195 [Alcanivorax sp. N3-2A]|nr:hypothetical protein CEK62_16195 [Alcanivorax sp. N3-2A]|tara:strand:+ start:52583 stop:53839 length:1257 start_codon:yes stop_codon:yes gene_type:complete
MISKWQWLLSQLSRQLWLRASLFAVLAVASALLAILAQRILPTDLPVAIGADSVGSILNILASSMLAVTTFSLSVMVSAYSAATSNVTPRATRLLMQDTTTQNVLSTFIGTFLFSLVGIVALSTGIYGEAGRLLLFAVTVAVIILIVVTILRWIDHLSRFGRVGETTERVEDAALTASRRRMDNPCLGGLPLPADARPPPEARPVLPPRVGYVQHLDVAALAHCAKAFDGEIWVACLPGNFVDPSRPLAWLLGDSDDEHVEQALGAFTLGRERSFDQDPRFGLSVMAEIASRALSPAVNDPGTAIDVLGRAVRVLLAWVPDGEPTEPEPPYPRVRVPAVRLEDLFDDVFSPIARDGASLLEVQVRLQKSLAVLARNGGPTFLPCCQAQASHALQYARDGLAIDQEKNRLATLFEQLWS